MTTNHYCKFAEFVLFLLFLFILGCSKDKDTKPSGEISHNDSTALVEILKDISKENPTMLDLGKITLPGFILNTDNEEVKKFVSLIERFNHLIENPQDVDSGNFKSSSALNYKKECETTGDITTCTFTEDHGDYKIILIQTMSTKFMEINLYYSGIYKGVDYGDKFLIQRYYTLADSLYFIWEHFRTPEWEEAAGEILFSYEGLSMDKRTIYTPWGTEVRRKYVFTSRVYAYDYLKHNNHINIKCTLTMDDHILQLILKLWSLRLNDLYILLSGRYDFEEMEGAWCTFDDYGKVTKCDKWWGD